jgi:hypothetical protein
MDSQFLYRTGITLVDLFFNSFTAILETQRAFVSGGILTAPATAKFGHSDQSRRIETGATEEQVFETGATEEQVIPMLKRELRIGKPKVRNAKAYRVSTKAEVSPKAPNQQQVKKPREATLRAGVKAASDSGVVEEQKKVQVQTPGQRKDHPNLGGDTKLRGTRRFHRRRSAAR